MENNPTHISAVVLAAGSSRRMGAPKMVLPWGDTTLIGQVVRTLVNTGMKDILVVTGGAREQVEAALAGQPVRFVYNPEHEASEMLTSLQVGLKSLPESAAAALVVLGDQPQMEERNVRAVLKAYLSSGPLLVAPRFHVKRGP